MTFEKLNFMKYVIETRDSHVTAVGNRGLTNNIRRILRPQMLI